MGDASVAEPSESRAVPRDRIAAAAVELLDAHGESGLTFRALARRLQTGPGVIQWHLANKAGLLQAATAAVLPDAMLDEDAGTPRETIRAIAVDVYDAIDAHPWLGAQLAKPPWQDTMLRIFEHIGRSIQALTPQFAAQFSATSTLLNYIIGAGSQQARTSRSETATTGRAGALAALSAQWECLNPQEWPFTRSMATQLRSHGDRDEFLAGVDLILDGLNATRREE
ncbi:TetR family transcriptional regulator [Microlunatus endophyticus]|uniref:TetR family transcriptional regulator n=1 Tax=Microlunatus endophyticus TaxID=1716077 RepID=A0A917W7E7_9ACTN|nr:helix-turn-helix domain-containing protein [Microlunatus endophyticus]GGL72320.1 TetR family transcriptional regulator [Microlunatus endophyticus]